MRLVTYRRRTASAGAGSIGALTDGGVMDLSAVAASMLELLVADGLDAARRAIDRGGDVLALDEVQLLAPLPRPNTIRDFMLIEEHVRNSFGEVPEAWYEIPVYWKGNPDTVVGPDATVAWPHYTAKLDFELEVGVIIGRRVWKATVEEAERAIAGYTVFNDWSARDIQFREMEVSLGPGLGKDFASSIGLHHHAERSPQQGAGQPAGPRASPWELAEGWLGLDARHVRPGHRQRGSSSSPSCLATSWTRVLSAGALGLEARLLDRAGRRRRARGAGHRDPRATPSAHGRRSCPPNRIIGSSMHGSPR